MIPFSRRQGKQIGSRVYFTGLPCKHGHICNRRTVNGECILCARVHYQANKQQCNDRSKQWVQAHPEQVKQRRDVYNQKYRKEHSEYFTQWWTTNKLKSSEYGKREYTKLARKKWNTTNSGKKLHYTRLRQQKINQATPSWADLSKIKAIYVESARITKETGKPHEVDHIIPLCGKNVCGLHVESNLQILPKEIHKFKGTNFNP